MASVARVGVDAALGIIIGPGAPSVLINGSPCSVLGDAIASHAPGVPPHTAAVMIVGSGSVSAEGKPVVRAGDAASCGHTVSPGSSNVNAG